MTMSLQQLQSMAQRQGIRLTQPRKRLLEIIASFPEPFTAGELVARADTVGRATVFRTLQLLCSKKILEQVRLADGQQVYVTGHPASHHHHIICNQCGLMCNITDGVVMDLAAELAQAAGFTAQTHRFEVYGLCANCQKQSPK